MAVILNVVNLRKYFGPEPVLSDITFQVREGDKIGLVGPNGCGKTTLLNILAGREETEKGFIEKSSDTVIGYLEQRPEVVAGRTVMEEVRQALDGLIRLQKESEEIAEKISNVTDPDEHERLARRFDRIHETLLYKDAYNIEYRIEKILHGVGFKDDEINKEVSMLSGGELNRLSLAKILLEEPDIMLLDEPSNHLDLIATEWLENFLAETKAAVILVSHDRYFLDRVTNRTFELFMGTVDDYPGNFTKYLGLKEERLAVQTKTYEKYIEEVEKAKDFIRRHHYGMKAAQAEDRRKKLERLEETPADLPRKITTPAMKFPPTTRTGDIVFRTEELSKGYGAPLFKDLTLTIERGERWAIIGPNGCGKTTFLKCLLGELQPDHGSIQIGKNVKIGYFDQHLHVLDDEQMVVDAIRPEGKVFEDLQRRNLLGSFGLTGDQQLQKVKNLSGGQRCRAALAMLSANDPNVMILDEPTNHLDLWARAALEKAILDFEGTVLFISHDRYFVDQTADHLLIIQPNARFRVLEGNYSTFRHLVSKGLIADPFEPNALDAPAQKVTSISSAKTASAPTGKGGSAAGQSGKAPTGKISGKSGGEKTGSAISGSAKSFGDKGKVPLPKSDPPQKYGKPRDLSASGKKKKEKRQRKFPFRKVEDIEAEVFMVETQIMTLREELIKPEVLRDGEKIKTINADIKTSEETLALLYEQWEEATELNW